MNRKVEEGLPCIVEERLQGAYESIRRGEIKQMKRKKRSYRGWIGIAAALVFIVAVPSVVFAAVVYFQKNVHQEEERISYEFKLNYDLVPGEFQVMPDYLPDGFSDQGDGKYQGEGDEWITVMPIYTMAELEKANGQIAAENIEKVEHTVLSGMEADVITFQEAEKYRANTYLFLFNEREGYVIHIIAGFSVGKEELLEFADNLNVVRTGDGSYETEEEKADRVKEEEKAGDLALEASKNWDALIKLGIPREKIYAVGEELQIYDGAYGYTVTGYEFLDSLDGFAEKDFFDYGRFDGWLNEDKTLRPYTRQHYSKDGELLSEEKAQQEILRVDIDVHCYGGEWNGTALEEVPLDFQLVYVAENQDGACTWAEDRYDAVPSEEYALQMDDSAVYVDGSDPIEGEGRKDFFFRSMEKGETISYTLLFIVDQDRKNNFLLSPAGSNNSIWQSESMAAEEMRDALEGYIRLE